MKTKTIKLISVASIAMMAGIASATPSLTDGALTWTDLSGTSNPDFTYATGISGDQDIYFFQEQSGYTLTSGLTVDIAAEGTYDINNTPPLAGTSVIASGTEISSYFVHFSPDTVAQEITVDPVASITFDNTILGVVLAINTLDASDYLGTAAGASYETSGTFRGHVANENDDVLTWSGNTLTINAIKANTIWSDEFRVITVPEPATMGMIALCGIGVLAIRRIFMM